MHDRNIGLYEKFKVERTDGSSAPGGKHEGCQYFTLDLTHDPHAVAALTAYRDSCRADFPKLAADLTAQLFDMRQSIPAKECHHIPDSDGGL